jgi:hypothetical protein
MQGFGHGAPNGYQYQYSNCTGRRKALLIGINYFNQKGQLRGCINDVKNMSAYLNGHFGYKREDMVILTDDQQAPMSQPTKANILRAMHWLVKDAQPNDSLFFHYSGHGGQTADLDGDEEDGYDEVIYPVDFRQAGHIVDDEMHRIMYVTDMRKGVDLQELTMLQGTKPPTWRSTDCHLRLLPLWLRPRPAVYLLHPGHPQGAQPCQGGWPRSTQHCHFVRSWRPWQHGLYRARLLQESD